MYKLPREAFEARIYTPEYRVYGRIHLIPHASTADLLNVECRTLLPVTGTLLYESGFAHPPKKEELKAAVDFLAVNKSRILWLTGGRPVQPLVAAQLLTRRKLALVFKDYFLAGYFEMPKSIRLSDFLSNAKSFQTLREAALFPLEPDKPVVEIAPLEQFEFVTVNLKRVYAVLEVPETRPGDMRLTLFGQNAS